jgi:hypothetical protein
MPHPALILDLEPSGGRALTEGNPNAPTYGLTLSLAEVRDAANDGVNVEALMGDLSAATFRRINDGRWDYDGKDNAGDDCVGSELGSAAEALDRVRLYWARRAKAESAATECAHQLAAALESARKHAQLFAAIADDGVFPIDRAQSFRSASAALGITIREIERCLNQYKVHGDVP